GLAHVLGSGPAVLAPVGVPVGTVGAAGAARLPAAHGLLAVGDPGLARVVLEAGPGPVLQAAPGHDDQLAQLVLVQAADQLEGTSVQRHRPPAYRGPWPGPGPPTVADLDGQRPPDGDDRSAAVVARPSHRDPQAVGVGRAHSPGAHLQVTFEGIEPNRALRVVVGELGGGDRVTAGPGAVATVHGVKGSDT